MANKKKLLIWCDSPTVPTGFGNVAKNLFSNLHQKFDVAILGINEFGVRRYDTSKYYIYPTDRNDMLGLERFPAVLKNFEPEIILLFQDIFNIDYAFPLIEKWNKKVPVVFYFPIDGTPVNQAWKTVLQKGTKLITYTKWGVNAVRKTNPELKDKSIEYLYHGVDSAVFYLMPSDARKRFKEERGWDNKFILLSVNRFQPRKMLPLVLKGHALYTKGYKECKCGNIYLSSEERCDLNDCGPEDVVSTHAGNKDAFLYVHANSQERMMGHGRANSIQAHILNVGFKSEDINKTLAAFGGNLYEHPLPESKLNELYNVADVNVSTTLGEGVGLSLIEASASGTTSIAPKHSSIPEMLGDTGHLVENCVHINIANDNGHLRPVIKMKSYLEAIDIEYNKWVANGRKKVINNAAIERTHTLFVWDDMRIKMEQWLLECSK